MSYKLKEQNGLSRYLMVSWGDIVMAHKPIAAAEEICKQNQPVNECIPGHPAFCIHAGDFYFEGNWEKPKSKKRIKDEVCE